MTEGHGPAKLYPYRNEDEVRPPDFTRVVAALSNAELADEIAAGRGGADYQAALAVEQTQRRSTC